MIPVGFRSFLASVFDEIDGEIVRETDGVVVERPARRVGILERPVGGKAKTSANADALAAGVEGAANVPIAAAPDDAQSAWRAPPARRAISAWRSAW